MIEHWIVLMQGVLGSERVEDHGPFVIEAENLDALTYRIERLARAFVPTTARNFGVVADPLPAGQEIRVVSGLVYLASDPESAYISWSASPTDAPVDTTFWNHPAGGQITVLPDRTLDSRKPDGRRKATSATAESLEKGHGTWTRA